MSVTLRAFLPRITLRAGDRETAWAAGTNGQNNLVRIWLFAGIACPAAVLAQELYEWRWQRLAGLAGAGLVFTLLGGAAALWGPFHWLGVVGPAMLAFALTPQLPPLLRAMELRSHEVEVQAAVALYGALETIYRAGEVGGPGHGGMMSYGHLKGLTAEQLYDGMARHAAAARRWVTRNRGLLEKAAAAADRA